MPAAGLRLGLCKNLATSPRVPRQTLRSPRERVVVFDSCSATFLEGRTLLFPTELARSSRGESQCERWSRQTSEHSPAEMPSSDALTLLLVGPVPAALRALLSPLPSRQELDPPGSRCPCPSRVNAACKGLHKHPGPPHALCPSASQCPDLYPRRTRTQHPPVLWYKVLP